MKAYIINMERSMERRKYMQEVMGEMPYLQYEFVKAVDGTLLREKEKKALFNRQALAKRYGKELSDGELGCALSHQKCYQKIIESDDNFGFIFEDDITLKRDIRKELEILKPVYDSRKPRVILWSGWFWYNTKIVYHGMQLGKIWDGFLAQAYIINKPAARIMKMDRLEAVADDWLWFRKRGVSIFGIIPRAFDQEWSELTTTIDHSHSLVKGFSIGKFEAYGRELGRKLFEKTGRFESCDYLERRKQK